VKVHVEDRVSDRCYITITVKALDTIEDLKRKMMILHNLPMEVQRWIIGKKIHTDQTTLYQCGVRGPGHTLYLYLVTARSVGLSRANYEAQLQAIMLMKQASTQMSQQSLSEPGNPSASLDPAFRSVTISPSNPSSEGDSLDQTAVVPISGRPTLYPASSSVSPGSVRLQEMLQSPNLSGFSPNPPSGTPSTPVESVLTHASPGLSAETWAQKPIVSNSPASTTSGLSNINDVGAVQALFPPSSPSGLPTENDEEGEGWECPTCTYRNLPMWPGCEMCDQPRPEKYQVPANYQMTEREMHLMQREPPMLLHEDEEDVDHGTRLENYQHLLAIEDLDLVPNPEPFQCAICFDDIAVGEGIVLRECLHQFCRDCLRGAVQHCENAILTCPYQDSEYSCKAALQEREVRKLVPEEMYIKYLQRGLDQAESQMQNSYHCKTPNCPGWCIYEDMVNFFNCPLCNKANCLTCKAIHTGQNCQQYQDQLKIMASNDANAKQTHEMLKNMVSMGEAMHCPQCQVIVQKKGGCDWIKCSICKTEICWVTKGRRWGPNGEGDLSGGCKCRLNGKRCHPQCVNCH
ncbi:hypothetical protein EGW08_011076, partial [Elysia chlorotica]